MQRLLVNVSIFSNSVRGSIYSIESNICVYYTKYSKLIRSLIPLQVLIYPVVISRRYEELTNANVLFFINMACN